MCVRSICIHPVPDVTEDEKRAKIQSSNIEQDLFEQAKLEVNVIKLLLLGKFVATAWSQNVVFCMEIRDT